jgi:hypothetical protein
MNVPKGNRSFALYFLKLSENKTKQPTKRAKVSEGKIDFASIIYEQ